MSRRTALGISFCIALTAVAAPSRSDACSVPPPIFLQETLAEPLEGVPTSGVVAIYVQTRLEEVEDGFPRVTVLDADEEPVPGVVELTVDRLVWRAESPLLPAATYAATLELSSWQQVPLTFVTASDDAVPQLTLEPGDTHFEEVESVRSQICCDAIPEPGCGIVQQYEHCWTQSVSHLPRLSAAFQTEVEVARYYTFSHSATGAASHFGGVGAAGGGWAAATFAERRDDYCLKVVARNLADGEESETEICRTDSELEELPPFVAEDPDTSMCEEPPVDPDTDEVLDTDDPLLDDDESGGCSASGGRSGALAVTLFLLLGLSSRPPSRAQKRG